MTHRQLADVGGYTYGPGHPMKPHRVRITHDLVSAYGMLDKMHVLRPKRATPEAMSAFHTDEYVNFLKRVTPETSQELTHGGLLFLVGELPDNPAFEGLFEYCSISAGGSIAAAQRITSGAADIAINWAGGLHHAKKGEASGFCFVNDIVLCILELLRTHQRVLYIDIDIHHGDGVEEAFYTTDRVMCASFHKFGEFFPGTGTQNDCGRGKGKGYSLNVPLDDGITDEAYRSVFEPVMAKIMDVFRPTAIVLQCGADSLSGDKLGGFNLSLHGHAACVQFMRRYNIPLVLLGGGGYTVKNVARAWTYETACALRLEHEVSEDLPWCEYFEWFGPRYRLEVVQSNMEDLNLRDGSLDRIRERALEQLQELASRCAPSVGMHDVPTQTLGSHLGFSFTSSRRDDGLARDELDEKLAQHTRYAYDLQNQAANGSDDSEESEQESNHSSDEAGSGISGRRRKRMSIMTNQYVDVPKLNEHLPASKSTRRQFFQVFPTPWDIVRPAPVSVLVREEVVPLVAEVAAVMTNGGQKTGRGATRAVREARERAREKELEREEEEEEMEVDSDIEPDRQPPRRRGWRGRGRGRGSRARGRAKPAAQRQREDSVNGREIDVDGDPDDMEEYPEGDGSTPTPNYDSSTGI
ncbi:Histone deacetylase RPD3 [Mycena indigotica]|uniref:histone deacetylase n=1 Tax=Mycena indigotica TaxID=2126181 RepID=A0A8H6WIC3_9AGAR|nr:Histone deacetylase RPD3 [Mycena indigotica]KAF7315978.1 Histone deacetylase RPD3 [Mycena indigotica]